jgi:hypothetical protein
VSATRLASVAALADPDALAPIVGPVAEVAASRLETPGFSGSMHERLVVRLRSGIVRRLVLKRTVLARDWTLVRSGDRVGREGQLLAEPALAAAWVAFACPYLAWAADDRELGLLMEDLSDHLLPDAREPMADAQEERLLGALASLHARFWESSALDLPWLARPGQMFDLLSPRGTAETIGGGSATPVHARASQGWAIAFQHVPPKVAALLHENPATLVARGAHLPRTLVHGDAKVANFALLPDGGVAAFDWAFVGAGPVAMELGWHLAVNSTRLAGTKEQTIARYRRLLEERLGRSPGPAFWADTEAQAVLAGGAMLLWSKALALEAGGKRAIDEWRWWVDRLAAL